MTSEAIPLLREIRDLVAPLDATIEDLRDQVIELRVVQDRERRRAMDEASKRRRLEHELRELTNRVHMIEGSQP